MCTVLPRARWLDAAVRGCEAAADSLETLEVGPLGLMDPGGGDETIHLPAQGEHEEAVPTRPSPSSRPPKRTGPTLPQKFLIQVDGVGSFLVLRGESVTIGPISSSERPEVGLMADPALPAVTIERADEDYFLRCGRPVTVNDQPTTEGLLADGDRIALSPRCRWRFLRPNAASTSAVLAISGARLPQADTRKVILLDREIIIGPGPTAHIRADRWDGSAVLHVRNGTLLCRSESPVSADGLTITAGDPLPLGIPLRIGSLSLIVTPA